MILITIRAIVLVYIISVRIILTWFQGDFYGKPWQVMASITDPYLQLFRGLKFLRQGMFDFTPIAAILVLVIILDLVNAIIHYGKLTLGLFMGSVISAVWSGVAFLLVLFLILAIIRAVSLAARGERESRFSSAVRMMLQPVIALVVRYIPLKRRLNEMQNLYLTIAILFIFRFLGGILIRFSVNFFNTLPI
ncbi:hypothetical protein ES703_72090 [subsurface metagenome]